jgi:predicted N-acetyltransferase YhbS
MTPHRAEPPYDWAAILRLIRTAFADMDARIDPASSMHRLTPEAIAKQAEAGEIWVIGAPPVACVFLTPLPDALFLGKLAVAAEHRGKGLGRALINQAALRARHLGLTALILQTRIELTENHAVFAALGFRETARTAHPGFSRPTTVEFRKPL